MLLPDPGAGPTPANLKAVRAYILQHSDRRRDGSARVGRRGPLLFPGGIAFVAEELGVDRSFLSGVLNGRRAPSLSLWNDIVAFTGQAEPVMGEEEAIAALAQARGLDPWRLRGMLNLLTKP